MHLYTVWYFMHSHYSIYSPLSVTRPHQFTLSHSPPHTQVIQVMKRDSGGDQEDVAGGLLASGDEKSHMVTAYTRACLYNQQGNDGQVGETVDCQPL